MSRPKLLLGLLIVFIPTTQAKAGAPPLKPGHIVTLAGTGKPGFEGDGGPAIQALLNQPFHVEADGQGHLYIAEANNHCIRKVNLKTGVISTVVGTGKKGYAGDGGKSLLAAFHEPYAVVLDGPKNLFLADRLNAVIRRVDGQNDVVATVVGTGKKGYGGDGGPGNQALLVEPNDVFLDSKGGLLIADVGDWRIRRLDLKTGVIATFAGVGRPPKAGKEFPRTQVGDGGPAAKAVIVGARAVCTDAKSNVYICEREGSAIRKVNSEGVISTIAGDGTWGEAGDGGDARKAVFRGPKGIRCDQDGNIYVVDCENHSIRKIDDKTNIITTVAGGRKGAVGDGGLATAAGLNRPHGCVVADGVLYIADSENHRVRMVKLK